MATVASIRSQSLTTRELLAGIKVIDVDTHVSEWPDLWTSRASAKWKTWCRAWWARARSASG